MSEELKHNILSKLYEKFFENHIIGMSEGSIIQQFSDSPQNDVKIAINDLEYEGKIYRGDLDWKISISSIDSVEDELGDNGRKEQRMKILEILEQSYQEDVDKNISHDVFIEKMKLQKATDILSQMIYLEDMGYIHIEQALGGNFWARLTASGSHFLND